MPETVAKDRPSGHADAARAFLLCATPERWIDAALGDLGTLLWDHANCEKKAASTAVGTLFRYPDRADLVAKMSRLAREELRHFEQVMRIIRMRGIGYQRVAPTRYAAGLHGLVRQGEPARLVDTLICGAFIEARSCERFAVLAPRLDDELTQFYRGLLASEARHFQDYLALADSASEGPLDHRIAEFAQAEADLITRPDTVFGFHSGPPV